VERLRTIKGAFAYAGKRYMAKKEEMPVMKHKPGRYWGVIGRQHLPLGKRGQRSEVGSAFSFQLFSFSAFASARQPWSEDFTAKLFCNIEFWLERLPKLNEPQPEFERQVGLQ
jgi:hypothetical protein